MIEIGKKAPAFKAKNQNGEIVSLKDFLGKKVALYFYPEDDTPTCTQEACNLRDNYMLLKQKGIEILGVSPDEEVKHKKFETKYQLPFQLLCDPKMKIINSYGVWGEKNMYGHKFMGIKRTTYLINEKGILEHIIAKVLSKKHHEQVLKAWGF